MNRTTLHPCSLGLLMILALVFAASSQAQITGPTQTIPVQAYGANAIDVQQPIVIETNYVTGEYVVCWALRAVTPPTTIGCKRFDADNNVLATASFDFFNQLPDSVLEIDIAVGNDGRIYLVVHEPEWKTYLIAFESDGSIFLGPETLPGIWADVAVVTTPDFVWVGGWTTVDLPGTPQQLVLYMLQYDLDGNFIDEMLPVMADSSGFDYCATSDLAATTSGDLLLTWIAPTFPGAGCAGVVMASTFTQDGSTIASEIQLSNTITDQDGDDITSNFNPQAVAHDNGEFAVAWSSYVPDLVLQAATITFGGTVAAPPSDLLPIVVAQPFTIAGYPQSLDYFVLSATVFPADNCTLLSRLVFGGDPTPDASFEAGLCRSGFDNAFNQAGDMMIAGFSGSIDAAGQVQVQIYPRPAQIEMSPVTVTEGDPARGIGNYAVLTASLDRPQPLGEDVTVNYFTRDNTAFSGEDYQQTSDTETFDGATGETTRIIQIPIVPDTIYEADELFTVNFSGAMNAVIKKGDESSSVTILNDDMSPEILADCDGSDPTMCRNIQEMGPGEFTETLITVTMAEAVDLPVNISYTTQPGGSNDPTKLATPGTDYIEVAGTLQIPPGATQASFNITVVGDDTPEDTETFQVVFSAGPSIDLQQPPILTFSILDDNLCFLDLDTDNLVFVEEGGTEPVALTTLDNTCQWTATPDDPWISLMPANGSDSQTIQVTAAPWDPMGQVTRSTNITIEITGGNGSGSAEISVIQDGNCSFTTDTASASYGADGGTGSIMVTASDPSCAWSVFTDQSWINITSPTSPVLGDGMVEYSVSDNGSVNVENGSRMASLISEEISFDISQDGCEYDVDPSSVNVVADGNDSVNINVTAGPTVCQWSTVSNSVWIIVADGASGDGDGTVVLDVIENPSVVPRMGSITIADEMVSFMQEGQPCDFDVNPENLTFCPDGDGFAIDISALAGCEWSLEESEDWLTLINNASGSGGETATGVVDANLSEDDRATSIALIATASGMTVGEVQIDQQGFLEYEPYDGSLPADWQFDPIAAFSVAGGYLEVALSAGGTGSAIHQNAMGTCSDCKVETQLEVTSVTSQSQEVATLVGWYTSDDDYVGFGMDEFANAWNIYQVSGGSIVASNSVTVAQILPNQFYELGILFDGTTFRGIVDGVEVVTVDRQGELEPFGYAGFMVEDSNARIAELRVTGTFQGGQFILKDSFEDQLLELLSACTQE